MAIDVRTFVRGCIHCRSTIGGKNIPRPFGPAHFGTKPNDLLQFDYLDLGPSQSGEKYFLMLKDDHSSYCRLFAFADTSADNAAQAIIDCCAAFGVPNGLMSDGPTHFKNETIRLLAKGLKVPHHFTLPYCRWSNGAVERLRKELIRTFRALLSEYQAKFDEWTDLLPVVQSVINSSLSPQRGKMAPMTAFLGRESTLSISPFLRSTTSTTVSLESAVLERTVNVQNLSDHMDALHPLVNASVQSNKQRARQAASRGKRANFTEGDFVRVAQEEFNAGEKLALRWRGPRRIIKALSDFVFQVEYLRNGTVSDIHASRLKFYRDSSMDTVVILPHILSSETGMLVARLMGLLDTDDGVMVQVRWKGLSSHEDTTEPFARVFEDVPQLLKHLLDWKIIPPDWVQKARVALPL